MAENITTSITQDYIYRAGIVNIHNPDKGTDCKSLLVVLKAHRCAPGGEQMSQEPSAEIALNIPLNELLNDPETAELAMTSFVATDELMAVIIERNKAKLDAKLTYVAPVVEEEPL